MNSYEYNNNFHWKHKPKGEFSLKITTIKASAVVFLLNQRNLLLLLAHSCS